MDREEGDREGTASGRSIPPGEGEASDERWPPRGEGLESRNSQLHSRIAELEEARSDLANLLDSTDIATLFLDRELRLRRHTPRADELIERLPADIGRPLADLSCKFEDPGLVEEAGRTLEHLAVREHEVRHDSGATYLRRISPYRTVDDRIDGVVITFSDISSVKKAERELARLNEELEEEVDRRTGFVHLLAEVTAIANEAADLEEALEASLMCIARRNGWEIGHAFRVSEEGPAVPSSFWHVSQGDWDVDDLQSKLGGARIAPGQGLVGAVLRSGEPQWSTDLTTSIFDRSGGAAELGLRTGLFFPVRVGERIVGVLEFFSADVVSPQPALLEVMRQVGVQLGRVFERDQLERQIVELAEKEQERISVELHDTVGQHLTGIGMRAHRLEKVLQQEESAHAETAAELVRRLEAAHDELRDLSQTLSSGRVEAGELGPALERLVEHCGDLCETEYHLELDPGLGTLDARPSTYLYRIAREAVHNAIRHAEPRRITMRITRSDRVLSLDIEDDGRGMELVPWAEKGIGLSIMKHSAEVIGGELEILSEPQGGTRVVCRVQLSGGTARPRRPRSAESVG